MKKLTRRLLPLGVVVVGFALAALLIATGPEVKVRPTRSVAPLVRVIEAQPQTVQLTTSTPPPKVS